MTDEEHAKFIARIRRERVEAGLPAQYGGKALELLASAISRHPSGQADKRKSAA